MGKILQYRREIIWVDVLLPDSTNKVVETYASGIYFGKMQVVLNLYRALRLRKLWAEWQEHVLEVGDVAICGLVVASNYRNRQPAHLSWCSSCQRKILTIRDFSALPCNRSIRRPINSLFGMRLSSCCSV